MVIFHHGFIILIFLAQLITLQHVLGSKVPAIIVFGDSSVDTGNNNVIATVLKSNFRPYGRDFDGGRPTGRFSNGRVPADFISEFFRLKKTVPAYLDPMYDISNFSTGVCFASAGTGYDNSTAAVLSVIPLWKEVEYYKEYQARLREYLGEREANHILSEAVYLISIGTNDFLENYYLPTGARSLQFTIEQYQNFLVGIARNFIVQIYNLGARKMSLGGLPPMGCLPLERTTNIIGGNACISKYNNVAKQFNSKLEVLVNQLNGDLPDAKVLFSNPYGILLRMIRRPSLYGFEETSRGCCATGRFEMSYLCNEFSPFTCTDATKFIFWDSFHPTEKANFIIAKHVFERSLGPKFL
ncbi:GDSL esterase/lipase-like protein [Drosera capensis]